MALSGTWVYLNGVCPVSQTDSPFRTGTVTGETRGCRTENRGFGLREGRLRTQLKPSTASTVTDYCLTTRALRERKKNICHNIRWDKLVNWHCIQLGVRWGRVAVPHHAHRRRFPHRAHFSAPIVPDSNSFNWGKQSLNLQVALFKSSLQIRNDKRPI